MLGSLQKDDDEISNHVDLHMGMLGGGWKWQDIQSLLWWIIIKGVSLEFNFNSPRKGKLASSLVKLKCLLKRLILVHPLGDLTIMGCIGCELLVGCGCGGGGRIHDDSSYRRDSVNGGARHGNFVRVVKDGDDNARN
ncbi:hypothetical protein Tco_0237066 [Tanacetum coccineum]